MIHVCDYILPGCLVYQNVLLQSLHWKFSPLYGAILCGISNHWPKQNFAIILQIFFRVSSSRVDRQMAICNAWKVKMWTSVRLLPRVGHFVSCKGLFMIWGKVTLITLMGFLSNVIRYVDLHMVPVNWRIIALIALMRSYPSSRLDMFS